MIRYGFELEGFYGDPITLPPKTYPTDGFPGLVELRTRGGATLHEAYAALVALNLEFPGVNYALSEHVFTREQKAELRRRHSEKTAWDIRNLYGRSPRLLGNRTIASLQLNLSNRSSSEYWDKDRNHYPERYGLLDAARIVRALDNEFAAEIKAAKRQPGEYAIKDDVRLEYRSLPNTVFAFEADAARKLLQRIKGAVEPE